MNINNLCKVLNYEALVEYRLIDENGDYTAHHFSENRMINHAHVMDIVESIRKEYQEGHLIFGLLPLLINSANGHVLDGQHRLEAYLYCVEHGFISPDTPVFVAYEYFETIEEERSKIILYNSKGINWKIEDYIRSYARTNTNYRLLVEFCESYPLCYKSNGNGKKKLRFKTVMKLINPKNTYEILKNGSFKTNMEELERAVAVHNEVLTLCKYIGYDPKGAGLETLVQQWWNYRDKIDLNMVRKMKFNSDFYKYPKETMKNWEIIFDAIKGKQS